MGQKNGHARIGAKTGTRPRLPADQRYANAYLFGAICPMPPTSGGLTILQILGMLERFDLADLTPGSPQAVHLISEASRLAFADRAHYMADSDFVRVPIAGLIDRDYLAQRAGLIDLNASMGSADAGDPPRQRTELLSDDRSLELPSTTHISVVDSRGNAVSMTSSIENAFGSRLMVGDNAMGLCSDVAADLVEMHLHGARVGEGEHEGGSAKGWFFNTHPIGRGFADSS